MVRKRYARGECRSGDMVHALPAGDPRARRALCGAIVAWQLAADTLGFDPDAPRSCKRCAEAVRRENR